MALLAKPYSGNPTIVNEYIPAEGSGKPPTMFTNQCALMGHYRNLGLAWSLMLYLESQESHTSSTSFSIWFALQQHTRSCSRKEAGLGNIENSGAPRNQDRRPIRGFSLPTSKPPVRLHYRLKEPRFVPAMVELS